MSVTSKTAPKISYKTRLKPYINSVSYIPLVPVLDTRREVLIKKDN